VIGGSGLPYHLQIRDADQEYLNELPLTAKAKAKIEDFIDYGILHVADAFRLDPANRPRPDGPYFQSELLFFDVDESGKKSYHKINFVINDANAAYGVLLLVYVDLQ
jgi:hypothetical protein